MDIEKERFEISLGYARPSRGFKLNDKIKVTMNNNNVYKGLLFEICVRDKSIDIKIGKQLKVIPLEGIKSVEPWKEYSWSLNGEDSFSGSFDTIEECIEECKLSEDLTDISTIHIGEYGEEIKYSSFIDIDDVFDRLYGEYGESIEDSLPELTKKEGEEIDKRLGDVIKKYLAEIGKSINYREIVNIKEYNLEE